METADGAKAAGELVKKQKETYDAAVALAKKTATDRTVSAEERTKLTAAANTEQKKLLALTTGVKQEEQRAFDAKILAKKKEQEIIDKANRVILDKTAKAKIYKDLKKVTFVAQSIKKVKFGEITATSYWGKREDHHPRNGVDGNRETYFALQGGEKDAFWMAKFAVPRTQVTRIKITSRNGWEYEANNAKIFIGEKLCGTMPAKVERSKVYTFDCEAVGDFVKIMTGRNDKDQKLTFANLEVYGTD